jgi:KUP system potassium uptake protein
MTVVYPSLLLIYLGQGAYFAKNPGDVSQGYFKAIPHGVYWPVFVVATLAAIVASQAIISGKYPTA